MWLKLERGQVELKKGKDKNIIQQFQYHYDPANDDTVYFAQTFPWGYEENQKYYDKLVKTYSNNQNIYQHKDTILKTQEKRHIDVLWLSSLKNLQSYKKHNSNSDLRQKMERMELLDDQFPDSDPKKRAGKFLFKSKFVVLTNRFSGYESQSSHILKEYISFQCSDDPRANEILNEYVFVIFPMMNPDGVAHGYSITDSDGQVLNLSKSNSSLYSKPDEDRFKKRYPSILALSRVIRHISEMDNLTSYFELRAPLLNKGTKIYGPNLTKKNYLQRQVFPYVYSSYESEYNVKKDFTPELFGNRTKVQKIIKKDFIYEICFGVMKNWNQEDVQGSLEFDKNKKILRIKNNNSANGSIGIKRQARNLALSLRKSYDILNEKKYLDDMKKIIKYEFKDLFVYFNRRKKQIKADVKEILRKMSLSDNEDYEEDQEDNFVEEEVEDDETEEMDYDQEDEEDVLDGDDDQDDIVKSKMANAVANINQEQQRGKLNSKEFEETKVKFDDDNRIKLDETENEFFDDDTDLFGDGLARKSTTHVTSDTPTIQYEKNSEVTDKPDHKNIENITQKISDSIKNDLKDVADKPDDKNIEKITQKISDSIKNDQKDATKKTDKLESIKQKISDVIEDNFQPKPIKQYKQSNPDKKPDQNNKNDQQPHKTVKGTFSLDSKGKLQITTSSKPTQTKTLPLKPEKTISPNDQVPMSLDKPRPKSKKPDPKKQSHHKYYFKQDNSQLDKAERDSIKFALKEHIIKETDFEINDQSDEVDNEDDESDNNEE